MFVKMELITFGKTIVPHFQKAQNEGGLYSFIRHDMLIPSLVNSRRLRFGQKYFTAWLKFP